MPNHNNLPAGVDPPTEPAEPIESARRPWHLEVGHLLIEAATLCIQHGLDVDVYMSSAWAAYVEARPGMRDQIEELELRDHLEELRKLGRIGAA